MTKPTEAELWVQAFHSVYFLRDSDQKMKLWIIDQGKIKEIPCPKDLKGARETRTKNVNALYASLLERYGYNRQQKISG